MRTKIKYEIGDRFGTVVVQENLGRGYWKCKCDCGKEKVYSSSELKNKKVCSLTCIYRNPYRGKGNTKAKHGDRSKGKRSRLYQIWDGMIGRCERKSQYSYHNYGGRGITICDEWRQNFLEFKKWAMDNGYKNGLTIDRIDNDGNYCPENCRWVTYEEQGYNRRNNIIIEVNGENKTIAQLSKEYGINESTLRVRYAKSHDSNYILRPVRKKYHKK